MNDDAPMIVITIVPMIVDALIGDLSERWLAGFVAGTACRLVVCIAGDAPTPKMVAANTN